MDAALTQLLSVGVVWIAFHCAGMCGPIVGGVVGGRARTPWTAVGGLLLYQAGRALVLSLLGALAGGVGASFEAVLARGGSVLTLVLAAVLLLSLWPGRRRDLVALGPRAGATTGAVADRLLDALTARLLAVVARVDARVGRRPFFLGMVLAFLPCMIIAWALSLAASTHSPWQGARVMAVLVAMTTLPLLLGVVAVALTRAAAPAPGRWQPLAARLRAVPLLVSGLWLVLVGLAGLGVLEHRHVTIDLLGSRTIMLF